MSNRRLRWGDYLQQDDRTGFVRHASEMVQEWNGQIVAREDAEPRHPQDLIHTKADRQAVPKPRSITETFLTSPVLPEDL